MPRIGAVPSWTTSTTATSVDRQTQDVAPPLPPPPPPPPSSLVTTAASPLLTSSGDLYSPTCESNDVPSSVVQRCDPAGPHSTVLHSTSFLTTSSTECGVGASPPITTTSTTAAAAAAVCISSSPQQQQLSTKGRRTRRVHIAIQGCCHGELDKIYDMCRQHERDTYKKIDFVLCCGDFQAIRDKLDMDCMAVPQKYKVFGDFRDYYEKRKRAPWLTMFIGGNHEGSNLLAEEYYGGYVADNIYYLGHSSVVTVCGVRIAALSGIYKGRDYSQPYPRAPYDTNSVRSAYHVRSFEVEKLERYYEALTTPSSSSDVVVGGGVHDENKKTNDNKKIDIVLSHDWPVGITKFGNERELIRIKPFFESDIAHGALGNPHTMDLLKLLKPSFWFAAHLHVKFTASVQHLGMKPGQRLPVFLAPPTEFIALDKCTAQAQHCPSRMCLTFVDVDVEDDSEEESAEGGYNRGERSSSSPSFSPVVVADPLWLAIVKATNDMVRCEGQGSSSSSSASWEHTIRRNTSGSLSVTALQSAATEIRKLVGSSMPMTSTTSTIELLRLNGHPFLAGVKKVTGAVQGARPSGVIAPPPVVIRQQVPPSLPPPAVSSFFASEAVEIEIEKDGFDWSEDVGA